MVPKGKYEVEVNQISDQQGIVSLRASVSGIDTRKGDGNGLKELRRTLNWTAPHSGRVQFEKGAQHVSSEDMTAMTKPTVPGCDGAAWPDLKPVPPKHPLAAACGLPLRSCRVAGAVFSNTRRIWAFSEIPCRHVVSAQSHVPSEIQFFNFDNLLYLTRQTQGHCDRFFVWIGEK